MLHKVTHCAGLVLANTRPYQLHWSDWEMETGILCIECSQVAGLVHTTGKSSSNLVSFCAAVHAHA